MAAENWCGRGECDQRPSGGGDRADLDLADAVDKAVELDGLDNDGGLVFPSPGREAGVWDFRRVRVCENLSSRETLLTNDGVRILPSE